LRQTSQEHNLSLCLVGDTRAVAKSFSCLRSQGKKRLVNLIGKVQIWCKSVTMNLCS
jgi:hypothetical protein